MAVTGETVYEIALQLIDEVTNAGAIDKSDLAIKQKAVGFLTLLQTELLPATITPVAVTDLSNDLLLSDKQCLGVLPYGLAAHLMIQDDAAVASFFNARYEELRAKKQATITPITDNYNVLSGLR